MKTIMLEVDDVSASDYENLTGEMKKQVSAELTSIIGKIMFDTRVTKLKKIVDEINADTTSNWLNPDIVLELLRIGDD